MPTYEGALTSPNRTHRFAIIAARFNHFIVEKLVAGAVQCFKDHGVAEDAVDLLWVPGSFEIPMLAQELANTEKYAAVICLGAVIRGDTDHYDYVAGEAARGVAEAARTTGVPVIFGILTCDNVELALDRAGGKAGNKGLEAALAAMEMADLMRKLYSAEIV